MIKEKLTNYISTVSDDERLVLLDVIDKVEALGISESADADEFLNIAADEINADASTVSCIVPYAYLSHDKLKAAVADKVFGDEVSSIITGILKIPEFNIEKIKSQNENHIKLLVTLSGDVRAIIILLAEYLQKIRHIKDLNDPESVRVATLVQYLYSPIAHRIGLYKVKTEMEEVCLKFFEYDTYRSIADKLQIRKEERDQYIKEFIEPLKKKFEQLNLKVHIKGRPKSISSIRTKMRKQHVDVDGIYDLFAIRVIIDSKPEDEKSDCWKVYSVITEKYKPNPYRLRDWISVPKSSGYESLHTTLIGPEGRWVEVQIRTERMDEIAEKGLAAHWKYKNGTDGQSGGSIFSRIREAIENPDSGKSQSAEKKALYSDEIYVFTPSGDLIKLRQGDTVLDFAFSIHSEVGSKCTGAHVNNKFVSFKHVLNNGDTIKVLTANNQKPTEDWIKIAHSSRAKTKIRRIVDANNNRLAEIGRDIIRQKLQQANLQFNDANVIKLIKYFDCATAVELYQGFGDAKYDPHKIKSAFAESQDAQTPPVEEKKYREAETSSGTDYLTISDMDTMGYTFAKCCKPLPGDKIFAFITADKGTKIHRYDCPNAQSLLTRFPYRVVKAVWKAEASKELVNAQIRLFGTYDMSMYSVINNVIVNEFHVHMRSFNITEEPGGKFTATLSVNLMGDAQLNALKERFKRVKNIEKVM
ncbi:MAG: TGS domain-containing protein [Bacteroidales bacterium]|nr:TGS domain-containing protein [Bacteroidales bacterium]